MDNQKRVAIVTGSAGGIGAGCARALAEAGLAVVVADVQAEATERMAQQLRADGHEALGVPVDVSQRSAVEQLVARAVETYGRVDVLVNDAGVNLPKQAPFLDMDDATWQRHLDVNLTGMFYCSQIAGRVMARQHSGSIINITSIGAIRPSPGGVAYHASKGGVISFTLALAVNLAPYGIRANAIGPGYIATPMTGGLSDPEGRARTVSRVPLGRVGQPEDFGGLVVFLGSEASSFITGQVIYVDGGASILGIQRLPLVEE